MCAEQHGPDRELSGVHSDQFHFHALPGTNRLDGPVTVFNKIHSDRPDAWDYHALASSDAPSGHPDHSRLGSAPGVRGLHPERFSGTEPRHNRPLNGLQRRVIENVFQ